MNEVLKDLSQAVMALKEVLSVEKTKITRDSALLRFQLCFELAWKAIKVYARAEGTECFSPKGCFQTAFQLGLVDYDDGWLKMITDRNLVVHLYGEEMADEIHSHLSNYLLLFEKLLAKLGSR